MAYTTINKPSDFFNTKLYTGTGSSNAITGVGFQPDFTWIKKRNGGSAHSTTDAVRGVTKYVMPDNTNAQETDANGLTAFGTDGFTVGSTGAFNGSGTNLVSWNWKANGAGSSNTSGSITSSVSANTTSGFSIVSYTGTGSAGATIGHGLGVVPKMIIVKKLSGADSWTIYHASLGATKKINFDTGALGTQSDRWNDTSPTSTVFTVGTNGSVNASSGTYIAYCFADVQGYSKIGSYVGNGNADGTFVNTGFKPAFILVKQSHAVRYWAMFDNKRDGFNPTNRPLFPNASDQESDSVNYYHDILSNGFKWRTNSNIMNESGGSYIYMAFAEAPLVGTNGVTAKAR